MKRHFLAFLIFTFTFATDNVLTHVDEMLEEVTGTGRKKVLVGEARSASERVSMRLKMEYMSHRQFLH